MTFWTLVSVKAAVDFADEKNFCPFLTFLVSLDMDCMLNSIALLLYQFVVDSVVSELDN